MNYSQIRAFHYVAVSGGFSRAAERLSLTQPAVSEQVRKLESDHDVLLFNRERKQITLTPLAEQLLLTTKQLFEVEERINDLLSERRAALKGHLRIMVDSAFHLTDRLVRFREKYPEVSISVLTGNSEDVVESLRNYDAEIGVVGSQDPGSDMHMVSLGNSAIVAVAAKAFLSDRIDQIRLSDLKRYPLILREKGSKTRQKLDREALQKGITLVPTVVAEGREAMLEIVGSGLGIGFVSEAEFGSDPRLIKIALTNTDLAMSETLIHLKQRKNLRIIRSFMNC
ncbi:MULTISPECIES: LysR substrate-binding domain-containing protein [Primorskyibacter]|uniref:Aminoethylphosphonate catabolism associated LysR family transcriptional regulator n=1 Tax=Primorskyibacter flagellatus TaxID=1387277 RepID=A0A1W2EL39_9RHOB|nr:MULTISPECIES: LysR substrate-binding domain-containing protein [Primorskyibacter]SMD10384.1 aminoethylphosphonate catabolism associated LysR family transcriptional regulator [Primorskyibacter flagellatus]